MDVSLRVLGPAWIVRHHADGGPAGVELAEHLPQRLAGLRIEIPGGLVGEQHGGTPGDGAGHRHQLLLTAGQVARVMLRARGQADALERRVDARFALRGGNAANRQRVLDVLVDRHVADQIEALKDEADVEVAHARPLGRASGDRWAGRSTNSGRR